MVESNRVCISLLAINYMFGLSQPVPTCPSSFLTFSPNDLYIYMGFLVIRLGQLGQVGTLQNDGEADNGPDGYCSDFPGIRCGNDTS